MQRRLVKVEYTTDTKHVIMLNTDRELKDLYDVFMIFFGDNVKGVKDVTIKEVDK